MAKRWMLLPILAICFEPAAFADPIRITSGGLVGDQDAATVTLASTARGFSLVGFGDELGGGWLPASCDGCLPGTEQSLVAAWNGSDFIGTATVDGRTFAIGLRSETQGEANVAFGGSWFAPPFTDRTNATVTSPFTFTGIMFFPVSPNPADTPPELKLVGSGIATLQLTQSPAHGGWDFVSATYRFTGNSAVPEPISLLLVGTGLGLIARRMRSVKAEPS